MSATSAGGAGGDRRPTAASGEPPDDGGDQQQQRPLQDAWQLLELAAIHHADCLAVVDCAAGAERQLTYGALFERSAALAAHLRASGVRRGDRLGLLSRNSSLVIEAHYAAAALHAVVVNMNIHLAPPELAYICTDAAPTLVLADTACAPQLLAAHAELRAAAAAVAETSGTVTLPQPFSRVVWMQVEGGVPAPPPAELPPGLQAFDYESCIAAGAAVGSALAGVCAEVLAKGSVEDGFHLYYTSGTTGAPKGMLLSHRIVVAHAVGTITGRLLGSGG